MSIKLVACDLDGTLLNDDKVISERNYKVIQTLEDNNIDFLICTGREKNSVIQLKERHHLNCEAIMMNGALYMDKNNIVCFSKKIADEAVKKIIEIFDKYDCDFIVQTLEGIRSRHTYEELIEHFAEHMVEIGCHKVHLQNLVFQSESSFRIVISRCHSQAQIRRPLKPSLHLSYPQAFSSPLVYLLNMYHQLGLHFRQRLLELSLCLCHALRLL